MRKIEDLPLEIHYRIFSFLGLKILGKLFQTCKFFNNLYKNMTENSEDQESIIGKMISIHGISLKPDISIPYDEFSQLNYWMNTTNYDFIEYFLERYTRPFKRTRKFKKSKRGKEVIKNAKSSYSVFCRNAEKNHPLVQRIGRMWFVNRLERVYLLSVNGHHGILYNDYRKKIPENNDFDRTINIMYDLEDVSDDDIYPPYHFHTAFEYGYLEYLEYYLDILIPCEILGESVSNCYMGYMYTLACEHKVKSLIIKIYNLNKGFPCHLIENIDSYLDVLGDVYISEHFRDCHRANVRYTEHFIKKAPMDDILYLLKNIIGTESHNSVVDVIFSNIEIDFSDSRIRDIIDESFIKSNEYIIRKFVSLGYEIKESDILLLWKMNYYPDNVSISILEFIDSQIKDKDYMTNLVMMKFRKRMGYGTMDFLLKRGLLNPDDCLIKYLFYGPKAVSVIMKYNPSNVVDLHERFKRIHEHRGEQFLEPYIKR